MSFVLPKSDVLLRQSLFTFNILAGGLHELGCFPGLPIAVIASCCGSREDETSPSPGLDHFRWGETHASYCNEITPQADLMVAIFSLAIH